MFSFLKDFIQTFLILFVMIDAIGIVPIFLSLTSDFSPKERKEIARKSAIVAGIIAVIFTFFGQFILDFFFLEAEDFFIAGGLLLLIIALDITTGGEIIRSQQAEREQIAVVPLGTPLLAGPGTITLVILLTFDFGVLVTALAAITNVIVAWLILRQSSLIARKIGYNGIKATSRVLGVILAAIAVSMIRRGLTGIT
ncbi:MAG: MarC family protein [Candidatus Wukongarchaeota archaeon]|nr:MarC family protein [Candidatus Wukongarchaeota archaeon]MDO8128431.1 MarC family protein [Candidatus Wukongarchaeota archaeon]